MTLEDALALLKLTAGYDAETAKAAWRNACRAAHPDTGGSAERFRRVQQAYRVVTQALSTRPSPDGVCRWCHGRGIRTSQHGLSTITERCPCQTRPESTTTILCPTCHGHGRWSQSYGFMTMTAVCQTCHGTGRRTV